VQLSLSLSLSLSLCVCLCGPPLAPAAELREAVVVADTTRALAVCGADNHAQREMAEALLRSEKELQVTERPNAFVAVGGDAPL
jgi:hypothetical protein